MCLLRKLCIPEQGHRPTLLYLVIIIMLVLREKNIFSDVVRGIKGFRTTARDYSASYNGGVKEEGVVMDSGCPTCLVSSQLLPGLLDKDTLIHRSDATQGAWVGSQLQSVLFAWDGCTGRKLQRDLNPN